MNIVQKEILSEGQYRQISELSYSSIKDFAKSRKRFYRKYILKEQDEEDESDVNESMILGNLVDWLITRGEDTLHEKFVTIDIVKGGGQLWELGEILFLRTKACIVDGEVTKDFTDLFEEAFNATKYNKKGEEIAFKKKKIEDILPTFLGSDVEALYKARRDAIGKIVVTLQEISTANKIKDELYNTPWTREILVPSHERDVKFQVTQEFEIMEGVKMKGMLDVINIFHDEKKISGFDLKCTYNIEDFQYNYFKNYYYLQACVYHIALRNWADENGYQDYSIDHIDFITCDSYLQSKPLIWETNEDNFVQAYNGWTFPSGKKIKGLSTLLKEIQWCQETNTWDISQENLENRGVCKISPFEEILTI